MTEFGIKILGTGHIGGKASGLNFMGEIFAAKDLSSLFPDTIISIPKGYVVATGYFEQYVTILFGSPEQAAAEAAKMSDEEILQKFLHGPFPESLADELKAVMADTAAPLAVRSSSNLEDSREHPFAGVYSTYMIPRDEDGTLLCQAVAGVWASTYFEGARSYCEATGNAVSEERMAVLIQEVIGSEEDGVWFPTISGVARSLNLYPIGREKPEDGVCNIVMGLGKAVVDGGRTLRFCPRYPKNVLQTSTLELTMSDAQSEVLALSLDAAKPIFSTDDGVNLERLSVSKIAKMRNARHTCSYFDYQNGRISEGPTFGPSYRVITFNRILKYGSFPLAGIVSHLLDLAREELQCPVEMEFAVNMDVPYGRKPEFYLLQTRPAAQIHQGEGLDWTTVGTDDAILYSANAIGPGMVDGIKDVVYMDFEKFSSLETNEIANELGMINKEMAAEGRRYVLIGTGRWGTSDPNLGVPVKWSHISQARVIVEAALPDFMPEASQGTHFFQNVTSLGVGYMSINQHVNDGIFRTEALDAHTASAGKYFKVASFQAPLYIYIDPLNKKAIIKPLLDE